MKRIAFLFLTALASCEPPVITFDGRGPPGPPGPPGSMGVQPVDPDSGAPVVIPESMSGARLQVQFDYLMHTGADGSVTVSSPSGPHLFDTYRGERCAWGKAPDGATRCLPESIAVCPATGFDDPASCAGLRVCVFPTVPCEDPQIPMYVLFPSDNCGPPTIRKIGAEAIPSQGQTKWSVGYSQGGATYCFHYSVQEYRAWLVTEVVEPSAFTEAEVETITVAAE